MTEEPKAHSSIVGGSTAGRRIACPGSYQLEQKIPAAVRNKSSVYADEGTALHEAMQYILEQNITDLDEVRGMTFGISESSPIGYVMTDDLVDGALAPCLDFFDALVDELEDEGGFEFLVECRCEMPGIPNAFGTSDIIGRSAKRSVIVDWKFGEGVPVKAEYPGPDGTKVPNPQPMFYGRAGMHSFPAMFEKDPDWPIDIYIVQPRGRDIDPNEPFTKASVTVRQLEEFRMQLVRAVAEAQGENPSVKDGPHCKFAACKTICPIHTGAKLDLTKMHAKLEAKRKNEVLEGLDVDWSVVYGELLDLAQLAEAAIGEIRTQAHAFLEEGHIIIDAEGNQAWKLVDKRPSESYVNEKAAVEMAMSHGVSQPETLKVETKSPAQLRAVLADKLDPAKYGKTKKAREEKAKELISEFTINKSSGTTLAPAGDGRREFIPIASSVASLSAKLAALTKR